MTPDDTPIAQAGAPDSIVALIPCPFELLDPRELTEIHGEHWTERVDFTLSEPGPEGPLATGTATSPQGVVARLVVEEPIPELVAFAGLSAVPYSPTEAIMLQNHQSVWRLTIEGGNPKAGRRAAKFASQLFATFVHAGALGVFMPALARLHAPRLIQQETMDLFDPRALVTLFVNAFHEGDWMRTRGLTAFHLPEVETPTAGGLNAAFFRLMDVSASMLMQLAPYPAGSNLQIGRELCDVAMGPHGIEADTQLPVNGAFGVLTVTPSR
jgi:hypothetical protein